MFLSGGVNDDSLFGVECNYVRSCGEYLGCVEEDFDPRLQFRFSPDLLQAEHTVGTTLCPQMIGRYRLTGPAGWSFDIPPKTAGDAINITPLSGKIGSSGELDFEVEFDCTNFDFSNDVASMIKVDIYDLDLQYFGSEILDVEIEINNPPRPDTISGVNDSFFDRIDDRPVGPDGIPLGFPDVPYNLSQEVEVLVIDGKPYPLTYFKFLPTGMIDESTGRYGVYREDYTQFREGGIHVPVTAEGGCTETHWHSQFGGPVYALDGSSIRDPRQNHCGFGKMSEVARVTYFSTPRGYIERLPEPTDIP